MKSAENCVNLIRSSNLLRMPDRIDDASVRTSANNYQCKSLGKMGHIEDIS